MRGIMDENPEGMIYGGADGVTKDGGEPYGEVGSSDDSEDNLKGD